MLFTFHIYFVHSRLFSPPDRRREMPGNRANVIFHRPNAANTLAAPLHHWPRQVASRPTSPCSRPYLVVI